MHKTELKAACRRLGSTEFWDRNDLRAWLAQGGPQDEGAAAIASAALHFAILDAKRFAIARQLRHEKAHLIAKLGAVNERRRRLSQAAGELADLFRAYSLLAADGWVQARKAEDIWASPPKKPSLSIQFGSQLQFMLESAVQVQDAFEVLELSSLWAFGGRKAARRRAKKRDIDTGKVRFWAKLLRGFLSAFAADSVPAADKHPSEGKLVAASAAELERVGTQLDNLASKDEADLAALLPQLNDKKKLLREQLVRLLIVERRSPEELGDAASTAWAREVLEMRDALWFPLIPASRHSDSQSAENSFEEHLKGVLSEHDLSPGDLALAYMGGRLAGGNLDRYELYSLEEREFLSYLRQTTEEVGPEVANKDFRVLPPPAAEIKDVRAELDIARRTAREIVKLRSFFQASLDMENEEIAKIVASLKACSSMEGHVSELTSAVSSLRRDVSGLGKSFDTQMSSLLTSEIMKDFLFAVDDISRIMSHASAGAIEGLDESLKMVISKMDAVLSRHGIRRIRAVGERFDPYWHDCVGARKDSNCQEGTVLEEVSFGYAINDKILRPAKVIVCG